MNLEFIGKAEVTNISNNRFKRVMLTIGIVCLLFAMIIEFIIGSRSAWLFVVPMIYLFSLRNQITKKRLILDVPMNVTIDGTNIEIIFNNTIRNKTGVFSEKYNFKVDDVKKCNYLNKYRELQILSICQYHKVSDSSVEIGKKRERNIKFKLAKDVEETLLNELEKKITIDYFG